ncbi:MAG: hypothetical protein FWG99_08930 [Treponema sp.]|nr:hypothetical protein [Treponema sp.]
MKKSIKVLGIVALTAIIGFSITGCETDGGSSGNFVAVTSITGVPATGTAGTPLTLTGTVVPSGATNKTIIWSVSDPGTTGATIAGSTLTTTAAGNVKVRATIISGAAIGTNYTQDFDITINPAAAGGFVAVISITGVPITGTVGALTLTGTVNPGNATNNTIVWSLVSAGTTGATLSGNTLTTTAAGTVRVGATIANGTAVGTPFTDEFDIVIGTGGDGFVPVSSITGVSTNAVVGLLTLNGIVSPDNATNKTITWSIASAGTTGASIAGNVLTTTAAGTARVRATITDGTAVGTDYTDDFDITISSSGNAFAVTFTGFHDEVIDFSLSTGNDLRAGDILRITVNGDFDSEYDYMWVNWEGYFWTVENYLDIYIEPWTHIGLYRISVIVYSGGVPYSKEVTFRVVR